jgi:hypothetical protein
VLRLESALLLTSGCLAIAPTTDHADRPNTIPRSPLEPDQSRLLPASGWRKISRAPAACSRSRLGSAAKAPAVPGALEVSLDHPGIPSTRHPPLLDWSNGDCRSRRYGRVGRGAPNSAGGSTGGNGQRDAALSCWQRPTSSTRTPRSARLLHPPPPRLARLRCLPRDRGDVRGSRDRIRPTRGAANLGLRRPSRPPRRYRRRLPDPRNTGALSRHQHAG